MARKPPRPGSAAYNRLYGAGGGRGVYAVRPPLTRSVPAQSPAQVRKKLAPPPGPMRESPVRTSTPVRPAPAAAAASANPWDSYLAQIDARERAARDEQIKMARARAMAYGESLSGFGQALQGNAAEQWGKVVDAYGRGAGEVNAYAGAAADSYTQGLISANQQIASDFAAIGQEGPANIRDTDAARAQVETVGNTRPGETMGLVGKAWGSYGETRPGTLGFMTQQNIMQSQRQAMEQEQQIASEFATAMADNPEQAMQMWGAVEEWKAAKSDAKAKSAQQKYENALIAAKETREAKAFELTVQKYNLSVGKEMADQAEARSRASGTVWVYNPQTGRLEDTGRKTVSQQQADTSRTNAQTSQGRLREQQAHNRVMEGISRSGVNISQGNLTVAQNREARLNKPKSQGGYSDAEKRQLGKLAGDLAYAGYYGVKDKDGKQIEAPKDAGQVLQLMLLRQVPYSIAYNALLRTARADKFKRWKYLPNWQKKQK